MTAAIGGAGALLGGARIAAAFDMAGFMSSGRVLTSAALGFGAEAAKSFGRGFKQESENGKLLETPLSRAYQRGMKELEGMALVGGRAVATNFMNGIDAVRSGNPGKSFQAATQAMTDVIQFSGQAAQAVAGFASEFEKLGPSAELVSTTLSVATESLSVFTQTGGQYLATIAEIGDTYLELRRTLAASTLDLSQVNAQMALTQEIMGSGAVDHFDDVANSIARFHRGLGLTGPALRDFTETYASMAELIGSISPTNIAGVLNAFEPTTPNERALYDYSEQLTRFTNIIRATGGNAQSMVDSMIRVGPAMRALGYDAGGTALFFGGLLEKGLRGQKLVYGMNQIVEQMHAKVADGSFTDLESAFSSLLNTIKQLQAAGRGDSAIALLSEYTTPANATLLNEAIQKGIIADAKELGKRAREGFDQSLAEAASETSSLADIFENIQQQFEAAISPVGLAFDSFIVSGGNKLVTWLAENQVKVAGWAADIGAVVLTGFEAIIGGFGKLVSGFAAFVNPVVDLVTVSFQGPIQALRALFNGLGLLSNVPGIGRFFKGFDAVGSVLGDVSDMLTKIRQTDISAPLEKFGLAAQDLAGKLPKVKAALPAAVETYGKNIEVENTFKVRTKTDSAGNPILKDGKPQIVEAYGAMDMWQRDRATGLALKDAQGNYIKTTATQPMIQMLGDAATWEKVKTGLRAMSIDITYDATTGLITNVNALNEEARKIWQNWFDSKTKAIQDVQVKPIDPKTGKPIEEISEALDGGTVQVKVEADQASMDEFRRQNSLIIPGVPGTQGTYGMAPPYTGAPAVLGAPGPMANGVTPEVNWAAQVAQDFKLSLVSGLRPGDSGKHGLGQAGDFSNQVRMGPPTPEMTAFANMMLEKFTPYISQLIYSGVSENIFNGRRVPTINQPGSPYNDRESGYHGDHVHIAFMPGALSGAMLSGLPALGPLPGPPPVQMPQVPAPVAGRWTPEQVQIANYIIQKALELGYTPLEALAFVAQAIGESGLDPRAFGSTTGDASGAAQGIFQFTPGTWQQYGQGDIMDARANIDAYMRLAAARDPRIGDIRSRIAAISKGGPAVPNNGPNSLRWDEYVQQAAALTTSAALPAAPPPPVTPPVVPYSVPTAPTAPAAPAVPPTPIGPAPPPLPVTLPTPATPKWVPGKGFMDAEGNVVPGPNATPAEVEAFYRAPGAPPRPMAPPELHAPSRASSDEWHAAENGWKWWQDTSGTEFWVAKDAPTPKLPSDGMVNGADGYWTSIIRNGKPVYIYKPNPSAPKETGDGKLPEVPQVGTSDAPKPPVRPTPPAATGPFGPGINESKAAAEKWARDNFDGKIPIGAVREQNIAGAPSEFFDWTKGSKVPPKGQGELLSEDEERGFAAIGRAFGSAGHAISNIGGKLPLALISQGILNAAKTLAEGKGSQQIKGALGWLWENMFASGGSVTGPGTETSDSIPAWLSDGEFVHNAAAVRHYGKGFMHAINSRQLPKSAIPGFAGGGQVGTHGKNDDWIDADGVIWNGATNELPTHEALIAAQRETQTGIFNPGLSLPGHAYGGEISGHATGGPVSRAGGTERDIPDDPSKPDEDLWVRTMPMQLPGRDAWIGAEPNPHAPGPYAEGDPLHGFDEGGEVNKSNVPPWLAAIGNTAKGFGLQGLDLVKGLGGMLRSSFLKAVRENPANLVNPQAFMTQMATDQVAMMAPLVGQGNSEVPASEAWKGLGKKLISYDEWTSGKKAEAFGRNLFDIATFFIPGGLGTKTAKVGVATERAATAAERPLIDLGWALEDGTVTGGREITAKASDVAQRAIGPGKGRPPKTERPAPGATRVSDIRFPTPSEAAIPPWALRDGKIDPLILEKLDGSGLSTLRPGELFDARNPSHIASLSKINWRNFGANYIEDLQRGGSSIYFPWQHTDAPMARRGLVDIAKADPRYMPGNINRVDIDALSEFSQSIQDEIISFTEALMGMTPHVRFKGFHVEDMRRYDAQGRLVSNPYASASDDGWITLNKFMGSRQETLDLMMADEASNFAPALNALSAHEQVLAHEWIHLIHNMIMQSGGRVNRVAAEFALRNAFAKMYPVLGVRPLESISETQAVLQQGLANLPSLLRSGRGTFPTGRRGNYAEQIFRHWVGKLPTYAFQDTIVGKESLANLSELFYKNLNPYELFATAGEDVMASGIHASEPAKAVYGLMQAVQPPESLLPDLSKYSVIGEIKPTSIGARPNAPDVRDVINRVLGGGNKAPDTALSGKRADIALPANLEDEVKAMQGWIEPALGPNTSIWSNWGDTLNWLFSGTWQGVDSFGATKGLIREGAADAAHGRPISYDEHTFVELAEALDDRFGHGLPLLQAGGRSPLQEGDIPAEFHDLLKAQGVEMLAQALDAPGTAHEISRGLRVTPEILEELLMHARLGKPISMPLSSFGDALTGGQFANSTIFGEIRGLIGDMATKKNRPVVLEVVPGARVATISGAQEYVTQGLFDILDTELSGGVSRFVMEQRSLIPDMAKSPNPDIKAIEDLLRPAPFASSGGVADAAPVVDDFTAVAEMLGVRQGKDLRLPPQAIQDILTSRDVSGPGILRLPIDFLEHYAGNLPDKDAVQALIKGPGNIAENGIREPLELTVTPFGGLVTNGMDRLRAARMLGMTHLPVKINEVRRWEDTIMHARNYGETVYNARQASAHAELLKQNAQLPPLPTGSEFRFMPALPGEWNREEHMLVMWLGQDGKPHPAVKVFDEAQAAGRNPMTAFGSAGEWPFSSYDPNVPDAWLRTYARPPGYTPGAKALPGEIEFIQTNTTQMKLAQRLIQEALLSELSPMTDVAHSAALLTPGRIFAEKFGWVLKSFEDYYRQEPWAGPEDDISGWPQPPERILPEQPREGLQPGRLFLGYKGGGEVWGAGDATSDSIAAWLSNGEFVHNAAAVQWYGKDFMHAVNQRKIPRLAPGGPANPDDQPIYVSSPYTPVTDRGRITGVLPLELQTLGNAARGSGQYGMYQAAVNPFVNPPTGTYEEVLGYLKEYVKWQERKFELEQKNPADLDLRIQRETESEKEKTKAAVEAKIALDQLLATKAQLEGIGDYMKLGELGEQIKDATRKATTARDQAIDQSKALQRAIEARDQNLADIQDVNVSGPPAFKPGKGSSTKGNKDAEDLGAGLVKGIFEGLGFPDVFGKPITEWGIWKKGMGLLGYGLSIAQARGDIPGANGQANNGLGPGTLPGIASGAAETLLPGAAQVALPGVANIARPPGSNVPDVPPAASVTPGMTTASPTDLAKQGIGTGPLPGPGVSIEIHNSGLATKESFDTSVNHAVARGASYSSNLPANGGLVSV